MSAERYKNLGFWVVNDQPAQAEWTTIVVGVARSGTSMIASMLRAMGVSLGERVDNIVHEDVELAKLLEQDRPDNRKLSQLVDMRNASHSRWAWKRPDAFRYIESALHEFRNPRFIIPFRDTLAISLRNVISAESEFANTFRKTANDYVLLSQFVERLQCPALLLSYEKSVMHREATVEAVADFLSIKLNDARRNKALAAIEPNRPEYLANARKKQVLGGMGMPGPRFIRGWAKLVDRKDKVDVEILVDDKHWKTIKADMHRPDLAEKGIGDGCYGFQIALSELKSDFSGTVELVARELSSGDYLSGSPRSVQLNEKG